MILRLRPKLELQSLTDPCVEEKRQAAEIRRFKLRTAFGQSSKGITCSISLDA
jgi:hypothetical protein